MLALRSVGVIALALLTHGPVSAETLERALARAYENNPALNAQRASTRATDENVPRAKSGFRPRANATADIGRNFSSTDSPFAAASEQYRTSRGVGVQIQQNVFDGFRTSNSVRQAESGSIAAREVLRNIEQNTLFDAAAAYMNVVRDTAIYNLQLTHRAVIEDSLGLVRRRFDAGEVTRTDVAQSTARLAQSRAQIGVSRATMRASIARYYQVIGAEPVGLTPARPLSHLVPPSLQVALERGLNEHPAIKAALHGVDVAELQIRITEGELMPSLGVSASAGQRFTGGAGDPTGTARNISGEDTTKQFSAGVFATLSVPLYDGGEVQARTRQAKETAGQRRLEADSARDQVRAAVIASWELYVAAATQIAEAQAQIAAAQAALEGVTEEAEAGQRTTLDILNSQQELLNARINLVVGLRDRVVSSYALVQASGRLSSRNLALEVEHYSPKVHFDQVKDLWGGLTTPDGR